MYLKNENYLKYFILFLIASICPLIEGQISFLFSSFLDGVTISSHLIILLIFHLFKILDKKIVYLFVLWCGLLTDFYYYKTIFLTLISYSIIALFIESFIGKSNYKYIKLMLVFLIACFIFEVVSYGIALSFNLTSETLVHFVTYNLSPSFIFNAVLLIFFLPIFND